ncbi:HNH endonuclease [Cellulophaga phage phi19:3]|uniref:HNH endonuclease n=1 Tax=Cellulophaga phage phi19:3 TaxID=1327971 RepID=R9ZY26_9CAUD|nr:HNH endonuclease [Cellulophaga phage phi19:3]AGO47430.1 HNH endonuclease [Cellulophaga phage phi19:3]
MEIWKPIKGYENIYQVSNFGRVKSLDRIVFNKGNGTRCKTKGRVLKQSKDKGGYLYVGLYNKDNEKTSSIKVHRLVAFSFCSGYTEGLEVNHKDGIRDNNLYTNLEWVTRSQNIRDTYKRGRITYGQKNNASKLMDRDIGVISSLYDSGVSQSIISLAFGVSQSTISNVIKNKHYKNGLIEKGLADQQRTN